MGGSEEMFLTEICSALLKNIAPRHAWRSFNERHDEVNASEEPQNKWYGEHLKMDGKKSNETFPWDICHTVFDGNFSNHSLNIS